MYTKIANHKSESDLTYSVRVEIYYMGETIYLIVLTKYCDKEEKSERNTKIVRKIF